MTFPRSTSPELLDASGRRDRAELAHNLRDMSRYDYWLGAYDLTFKLAVESLAPSAGEAQVGLDIGVGAAGFVRYAAQRAPVRWVGLDLATDVLQIARGSAANAAWLCANATRLPLADWSVDVVACVHTLHHLDEPQAVTLLTECARVARRRVVVLDLARGYLTLAGAWLLTRVTSRNRMTLADGVQSARRAYTPAEACALAARAGLQAARISRHGPAHYSLVWARL